MTMLIFPVIKGFYSPDVEHLPNWVPSRDQDVFVNIELSIGTKDRDGTDIFQVVVATPEAIRKRIDKMGGLLSGRGLLVVAHYDWKEIFRHCQNLVTHSGGDTWSQICEHLSRHFLWEFENYVESREEKRGEKETFQ